MDVLDWLNIVLSEARWLRSPEEALALLPDIGVDAPAHVKMIEGRDQYTGFPVAFADRIREPLAEFIVNRVSEQVEGRGGEQLRDLSPDKLGRDELVLALANLLVEAGELGRRSTSLVMLELARQSSLLCSGDMGGVERRMPAVQSQLGRYLPKLASMEPEARGAALARVAWSLSARLSFAWAMAGKINPHVRPTRLHQALVGNKAALVVAHGHLDLPRDAAMLAALCGIKTAREQLEAVHVGVTAACRHAFGTDTPAAKALRDLAGTRSDPASLALDPGISNWVLNGLEDIAPTRVLTSAGVGRAQLRILTDRRAIPALAAAYARVCRVARGWDVLSCAANRAVPVEISDKKIRCAMGDLHGQPYRLLAPRGKDFNRETYIVGVNREHLFEAAAKKAGDRGVAVYAALSKRWVSLAENATHGEGAISSPNGAWFAAFPTGTAAEAFATEVDRRFRSPIQLDLAPLGPVVSLDSNATVVVRIEGGPCIGGWDGETLNIRGGAVDRAMGSADEGAHAGLAAIGAEFARQAAKPAPKADPPPSTSRPVVTLPDTAAADPFASGAPPEDEDRDSGFGFASERPTKPKSKPKPKPKSKSAPRSPAPAPEAGDIFSTSFDSDGSDLSFGGDDPFSTSMPVETPESYSGPDDPFATMMPDAPQSSPQTPSIPPMAEASEDAFAGIEREESVDEDLGGASEDPLISNPPLGEDSLGFATAPPKADPFSESLDQSSLDEASGDMAMEIVDDDDSEFIEDVDSAGIFFLPPPTPEQLESLGARLGEDVSEPPSPVFDPIPSTPTEPSARTLIPERSLDSLDRSLDEPATLVPELSIDAPTGTLVPDDLAAYDFEDASEDASDGASPVGIAPAVAEPDNLLSIAGADADFGFTDAGEGDVGEVLDQLAADQEVVLDQPSVDRDDLDLAGGTSAGFMVAGPAAEPEPPPPDDDPFGFATVGDGEEPVDGDPFAQAEADEVAENPGDGGFSSDDLRHLFDGYVWLEHEGTLVFGRRYGEDRLVDVHRYELGQLTEGYRSFMLDKVDERFVPQTDDVLVIADGTPLNDVDVVQLQDALSSGG